MIYIFLIEYPLRLDCRRKITRLADDISYIVSEKLIEVQCGIFTTWASHAGAVEVEMEGGGEGIDINECEETSYDLSV